MVLIIPFILFFAYLIYTYKDRIKQYFLTPKEFTFNGFDLEILEVINKHRLNVGLNELDGALNLTELAESHVIWMNDNEISHYGYTDRQLKANAKSFAEVICSKRNTATNYLLAYLGSKDGHKEAIEKKDITHIGIYTHSNGLQCILLAGY